MAWRLSRKANVQPQKHVSEALHQFVAALGAPVPAHEARDETEVYQPECRTRAPGKLSSPSGLATAMSAPPQHFVTPTSFVIAASRNSP
jgi:hypothetical protein